MLFQLRNAFRLFGEELGKAIHGSTCLEFDGNFGRAGAVPGKATLQLSLAAVVIEIIKATAHGFHQARLPGAVRAVQDHNACRQVFEIEFGDATPVFEMNSPEDHALTSRAI